MLIKIPFCALAAQAAAPGRSADGCRPGVLAHGAVRLLEREFSAVQGRLLCQPMVSLRETLF